MRKHEEFLRKFVRYRQKMGKKLGDITPLLDDTNAFRKAIKLMSKTFKNDKIDKVVGIEARGFIFGCAVSMELNCGFVPIRKENKLIFPVFRKDFINYRGKREYMEIHKDAIKKGENVLIVDDWLETGESINAAIDLIEKTGGRIKGISVFYDCSLPETRKKKFSKYVLQAVIRSHKQP
ncbi:MAG: adenine phosphoribosyltransferase [Candidatus Aenigmarchaeota archaeon]|nr:adenine phosphoribosyltransferase [Candidatus Aenigmarchaeota archaeon]